MWSAPRSKLFVFIVVQHRFSIIYLHVESVISVYYIKLQKWNQHQLPHGTFVIYTDLPTFPKTMADLHWIPSIRISNWKCKSGSCLLMVVIIANTIPFVVRLSIKYNSTGTRRRSVNFCVGRLGVWFMIYIISILQYNRAVFTLLCFQTLRQPQQTTQHSWHQVFVSNSELACNRCFGNQR